MESKITLSVFIEGMPYPSVHTVYPRISNNKLCYLFEHVSGTSVMNWTKNDYEEASKKLMFEGIEIWYKNSDPNDTPVLVPESFRQ